MKGKITYYNEEKGWGFILGEDAEKYFFHIKNTKEPLQIEKSLFVQFDETVGKANKLAAINVSIDEVQKKSTQHSQNKIIINGEAILTSSILSYEIEIRDLEYSNIDPCDRYYDESSNCEIDIDEDDYLDYDYRYDDCDNMTNFVGAMKECINDNYCYWQVENKIGSDFSFEHYVPCNSKEDKFTYKSIKDNLEFNKDLYLENLENGTVQKRNYFIKIKFKNGKKRNLLIGTYTRPYEIISETAYLVTISNWEVANKSHIIEFNSYYTFQYKFYRTEIPIFNIPKIKYLKGLDNKNKIFREAEEIISDLNQLV